MIRKIDCVMIPVGDLEEAAAFYARVFDLRPLWQDASSAGLGMPETDAEIVLHTMELPPDVHVHYLVDDVITAVATFSDRGAVVRTAPFDIGVGRCAVLEDPYRNPICLLDLSKGGR
jgi:predicted enzyme related to lactoylglutathione lyase